MRFRRWPKARARWVSDRTGLFRAAFLALFWAAPGPAQAQILPDGTTATTVATNPAGRAEIAIAPASAFGVSLNRYSDFNVAPVGVDLDNRVQEARTIVNEVTGANPTHLAGPIEVLGQRAHVITANPNGISVDGARFLNTGRVALATGTTGTVSRQIAPGVFRDNITASVNGGTIDIGAGGLSGQMSALVLLAEDIRINGPVVSELDDAETTFAVYGGGGTAEFDNSILPGNVNSVWSVISPNTATDTETYRVTIGPEGVLDAGSVSILVGRAGAGVRMDGVAASRRGGFVITAEGRIEMKSANVATATGAALISSGNQVALDAASVTVSSGDFILDAAGDVTLNQAYLGANGAISLSSGGNMTLTGDAIEALGSVSLRSVAALSLTDQNVVAQEDLTIDAGSVALTSNGENQAQAIAATGALALTTRTGDFVNRGTLVQGGANLTDPAATDPAATDSSAEPAVIRPALSLSVAGDIQNLSAAPLATIFALSGDMVIAAAGSVTNNKGRFVSNGNFALDIGGDLVNTSDLDATAPIKITRSDSGKRLWQTLFLRRERSDQFVLDFGSDFDADQLAAITAAGDISLDLRDLRNLGASINANGGSIDVTARQVAIESIGRGKVDVIRICGLRCRYVSNSDFTLATGALNATDGIAITATESLSSLGGVVYAENDVTIDSPDITLTGFEIPHVVSRRAGLHGLFAGRASWVFLRDEHGSLIADTGTLSVTSDRPLRIDRGLVQGGQGIIIPGGTEIVKAPDGQVVMGGGHIGLFRDIPPVSWN